MDGSSAEEGKCVVLVATGLPLMQPTALVPPFIMTARVISEVEAAIPVSVVVKAEPSPVIKNQFGELVEYRKIAKWRVVGLWVL
jgi:hypothetical protein